MESGILVHYDGIWYLNLDSHQSYSYNTMKELLADENWWENNPFLAEIMSMAVEAVDDSSAEDGMRFTSGDFD